ncbi:MAG: DUF4123 domain-containing protein [Marinobacter sp.]|nr:DUF4123 domain-containing protein [Marinobacter sp.]
MTNPTTAPPEFEAGAHTDSAFVFSPTPTEVFTPAPTERLADWYLVDLAAQPDALKTLYSIESAPDYALLYMGTSYQDVALQGPLLVKPTAPPLHQWLQTWATQGRSLALHDGGCTLQELGAHFVNLTHVHGPYGPQRFRYASAFAIGSIGPSLTANQRLRLLGPLQALHGEYDGRYWSLKRQRPDQPGMTASPFTLTPDNLKHHARERRRMLAESLARSYSLDTSVTATWFEQLQRLGAPSEQALVEASHILARQALVAPMTDAQIANIEQSTQNWPERLDTLMAITEQHEEGTS